MEVRSEETRFSTFLLKILGVPEHLSLSLSTRRIYSKSSYEAIHKQNIGIHPKILKEFEGEFRNHSQKMLAVTKEKRGLLILF